VTSPSNRKRLGAAGGAPPRQCGAPSRHDGALVPLADGCWDRCWTVTGTAHRSSFPLALVLGVAIYPFREPHEDKERARKRKGDVPS
jgi:hypothetical protein